MRLRTEILIAMVVVVVVTTLTLGMSSYVFSMRNEAQLLSSAVNREIEFVLANIEHDADPQLPETSDLKIWIDSAPFLYAPASFQHLPLGETHDVKYLDRQWHVIRRDTPVGLLTAAQDVTEIEEREAQLRAWIAAAVGSGFLIGLLLALSLSRRIGRPIGELARAVDRMESVPDQTVLPMARRKELRSIARAVDALYARQKESIARERLFSAAASHELRTPIAVIRSAFELAEKQSSPETLTAPLQRARRAADTLTDLVDSLLFIARERPTEHTSREMVTLETVARSAVELLAPQMTHIEVTVQALAETRVEANPTHVRVLLINLLRNAAQHSSGGEVRVVIEAQQLHVIDSGSGLPKGESLEELMAPYVSTAPTGETQNRYGLGLYIVHRICKSYGWKIAACHNPGGGTRMSVSFRDPGSH